MKRTLLSILALSLGLAGSAFATVRTNGMAINQDDTMDYGNIYAFPQLAGKYANILRAVPTGPSALGSAPVNGELLINAGDKTITLGYAAGTISFLGGAAAFSTNAASAGAVAGQTTLGAGDFLDPDQKLQVGIALPMGSGLLGARISWAAVKSTNDGTVFADGDADDTFTHTETSTSRKAGEIAVDLGYGMEDAGPFKNVDIGARIALNSAETTFDDPDTDNDPKTFTSEAGNHEEVSTDGATDISIRLRGVKEQGEGSLVFNLGFLTSGLTIDGIRQVDSDMNGNYQNAAGDIDSIRTREYKRSAISVGAAYNKPINDGGLLVVSARLSTDSTTFTTNGSDYNFGLNKLVPNAQNETKTSDLYVPLAVGVEDKLGENLKGRLGVKKNVLLSHKDTTTSEGDLNATNDGYSDTFTDEATRLGLPLSGNEDARLYIGLSATKGKFYSDWVIEHDIFWHGPDFLFGGGSGNFAAEWEVGLTF